MGYKNPYLTEVIWTYIWEGRYWETPHPLYLEDRGAVPRNGKLTTKELFDLEVISYTFRTWSRLNGSIPPWQIQNHRTDEYSPPNNWIWEARVEEHLRGGESNFRTTSIHPLSTDEAKSAETRGYFCHVCGIWDVQPRQECRGCGISSNIIKIAFEHVFDSNDDIASDFYNQLEKSKQLLRVERSFQYLPNPQWRFNIP
jgi:hypothetical protein